MEGDTGRCVVVYIDSVTKTEIDIDFRQIGEIHDALVEILVYKIIPRDH